MNSAGWPVPLCCTDLAGAAVDLLHQNRKIDLDDLPPGSVWFNVIGMGMSTWSAEKGFSAQRQSIEQRVRPPPFAKSEGWGTHRRMVYANEVLMPR